MFDTTPEIAEKMREMIQKKSPTERLKMGSSMFQTSRQLLIRFILEENPGISEVGIKQQLFLKLYGDDFSPEERERILKHIEEWTLRQLAQSNNTQ